MVVRFVDIDRIVHNTFKLSLDNMTTKWRYSTCNTANKPIASKIINDIAITDIVCAK